ncbi:MAG: tRNA epoxyqueuosine(34) reductase QueG [Planctomycetia bacterium]|nr:tRNA epoxyqueuosine(34) reductase QueG [Planctomycetia bacterium]
MANSALTDRLKHEAQRLGFALCGVTPAATPTGLGHFAEWLSAGYAGEMHYLADRHAAYAHPRHVLDGVRSLVMLGMSYARAEPASALSTAATTETAGRGRVARYALGSDYHDVIHDRLAELASVLRAESPGAAVRGVVDTAPLLEREFAELAGLGWVGKNTLLLNRQMGSWFFLAALLTDQELAYDQPHGADHCGTCTACLDACPTGAFVAPYVLDSRKCISYLTIELKTAIPAPLRADMGDWLFGCDVCQEVCPWNHHAAKPAESESQSRVPGGTPQPGEAGGMDLIELFWLDDAAFRARFRHTPLWRPKRRGILRNAAIVLGNQRTPTALPALIRGLNDVEPLVRGACAWALCQFSEPAAQEALQARRKIESDATVLEEIQ